MRVLSSPACIHPISGFAGAAPGAEALQKPGPQTRHSYCLSASLSDGQRPGEAQARRPSYTGASEIRNWAAETDQDRPIYTKGRQRSSLRLPTPSPKAPPTSPPTAGRFTPASGATSWEPAGTFLLLGPELVVISSLRGSPGYRAVWITAVKQSKGTPSWPFGGCHRDTNKQASLHPS